MEYAVLPAGKLFRPKLVEALGLDLNRKVTEDYLHLASAIELHHAYTLVHDDLPAMDNDAMRRGKPSTHIEYGEWQAILAGDALLISSFGELMKIDHPRVNEIHRLFTWCTGAKGLISGQFLDLSANGKLSFPQIVRIHELKTARLIQVGTLGAFLLSLDEQTLKKKKSFLKLGREIGVTFQLLDDLSELTEAEISDHEKMINPFLLSPQEALKELRLSHLRLGALLFEYRLENLEKMLHEFFQNGQQKLIQGKENLEKNVSGNRDLEKWITSFV